MKFDPQKKTNRFTLRTLEAFSSTMFSLLQSQSFESITVLKICELTKYPRATFYNYFTDKYDLLEYCWSLIHAKIHLESPLSLKGEKAYAVFEKLYDFFKANQEGFMAVTLYNKPEGELFESFHRHLQKQIFNSLSTQKVMDTIQVPLELWVRYTSSTVMLVLEYCLMDEQIVSKEQARSYLEFLLRRKGI